MSQMIEVNVAEATGAALDWMVAKADNFKVYIQYGVCAYREHLLSHDFHYSPSTDWSQGGPLIEKHKLHLHCDEPSASFMQGGLRIGHTASTVLIAACRAIVTAKLGDNVMVPACIVNPAQAEHTKP